MIPIRGLDEGAEENYESYFLQDYPGKIEIIFCVESEDDPAVSIIRQAIAKNKDIYSQLIFSGADHDHIGKIHNLAAGLPFAKNDVIVFVDSDVRMVDRSGIRRLVAALHDDRIGMVTCYQACFGCENLPAALISLMTNSDMLGYFSILAMHDKLNLANGATMAIKREILDACGGLSRLKRRVLNDTALARQVIAFGKKIALAPFPAHVIAGKATFAAWWQQVHRWHVAMKSFMPFGEYLVFGLTRFGLFAAILYSLLFPANNIGPYLILVAILCRALSLSLINAFFIKDITTWKYFPFIFMLDILNPVFWIFPYFSRKVIWRGRRYKIYDKGEAVLLKQGGCKL